MSTLAQLMTAATSTRILSDGYSLEADNKGYSGNIRFWFAGSDLSAFTNTVTGVAQTLTIAGTSVSRKIPLVHPYITGGNCYCDGVHVYPPEGAVATLDGTGNGIAFNDYFADVHFSTPSYPYESGSNPCVTVQLQGGEDLVTRPGSAWKFPSDGLRINHDVGVPVKTIDFTLTMHRLSSLNLSLYTSVIGAVNFTTFFGMPPGTVLYNGPGCSGQYTIAGADSFDVAHQFSYRSIPHNMIMRPDGNGFEAPIQSNYGGTGASPTTSNEESETNPIFMFPEEELNALWGM